MPFGKYDDHADCVRQNQDKRDPDAYCAAIERAITGKAPSMALPTANGLRPIKPIVTITRQRHGKASLL